MSLGFLAQRGHRHGLEETAQKECGSSCACVPKETRKARGRSLCNDARISRPCGRVCYRHTVHSTIMMWARQPAVAVQMQSGPWLLWCVSTSTGLQLMEKLESGTSFIGINRGHNDSRVAAINNNEGHQRGWNQSVNCLHITAACFV